MSRRAKAKKGQSQADLESPANTSRRAFLGTFSGVAAAAMAAGAIGLEPLVAPKSALAHADDDDEHPVGGNARKLKAFRVRVAAAEREFRKPLPKQVNNGDEILYSNFIGQYSKAMLHNGLGEPDVRAYQAFLRACTTGKQSDFERIPMGGTVPLTSPQAGLAFPLEGADYGAMALPPSPTLASVERAGEMVECYWHALARDIPFSQYGLELTTLAAIADLNKLSNFRGPKQAGAVTGQTLFRGFTAGDVIGPYVSQFFLMPFRFGLGNLAVDNSVGQPAQLYNCYVPGLDYMTDTQSWLAVQNGQATDPSKARGIFFAFGPNQFQANPAFLHTARDIAGAVHVDELYQHYFFAAAEMLADGSPPNPGNPYGATKTPTETAFATFGGPHVTGLIGDVALRAIQNVWYQKYFVHRPLRPEEYGGRVHNMLTGAATYPLHPEVLNSDAVARVFSQYGTYYLPMAYPEGCPTHPSYGSGHTTVAAACVTLLKAFFDETTTFVSKGITPVYSPDGVNLLPYTGSDADQITVGTELNKMASNVGVGRNLAGVHWRSDYQQSMRLGETTTINILQDLVNTYNEEDVFFQFTKFDGTQITIGES